MEKSGIAQGRTGTPLFQAIAGSERVRQQTLPRMFHRSDIGAENECAVADHHS
jgi:hypothetical protein